MKDWSTDKIAVTGLVAALLVSIFAGIWTGNGVELQTTIASGLVGYIGRAMQEKLSDYIHNEEKPTTLEKVAATTSEAQKAVDAVNNIKDIVKK